MSDPVEEHYLRTGDRLALIAQTREKGQPSVRVALAATGFGGLMCHLESLTNHNVPADIISCSFVCDNAMSKKALHELLSNIDSTPEPVVGHKTLLYGHAICLKHCQSGKYLACMTTSPANDKLAFDVGLTDGQVERSWWILNTASKQRADGDKVRVNDEIVLTSVSSERYIYAAKNPLSVVASFQSTPLAMTILQKGDAKVCGYVSGGDVVRIFKGQDEYFTSVGVIERQLRNTSPVIYECGGDVGDQSRSLWRIEFVRSRWNCSCLQRGQSFRLRHLASGKFLSIRNSERVTELIRNDGVKPSDTYLLDLVEPAQASCEGTLFAIYKGKDEENIEWDLAQDPLEGQPAIQYNDDTVYFKHVATNFWLSSTRSEANVPSQTQEKRVCLLHDGQVDDGFTLTIGQSEEVTATCNIMKSYRVFTDFLRALRSLRPLTSDEDIWVSCNEEIMNDLLQDLITYFTPSEEELEHEERQMELRNLKNRQALFQDEGFINILIDAVEKLSVYRMKSREFDHNIDIESMADWSNLLVSFFTLLAALIRGNRNNCSKFAEVSSLDWLIRRLGEDANQSVLDVIYCVLQSSPEAVCNVNESHIQALVAMLDKCGRDAKILEVFNCLCITDQEAIRNNQNWVLDNILPSKMLLIQTQMMEQITSVRPKLFIGVDEGSAMYDRWYYEVHIESVKRTQTTHLRVGWASTAGYRPYPTSGDKWGGNGVGDDLYSWGFDGVHLWTDSTKKAVKTGHHLLNNRDIIGCCLDLSIPRISFTINGIPVRGSFEDFNITGLFYPVVSLSSHLQVRMVFGSKQGAFSFNPPSGFAKVVESAPSEADITVESCIQMTDQNQTLLLGPASLPDCTAFKPNPVDLTNIELPQHLYALEEAMAENLHEQWSIAKIEGGWIYGEAIDENRRYHPCLRQFSQMSDEEKFVDKRAANSTLRTILSLGYNIKENKMMKREPKRISLPNNYMVVNGYKPAPYDITFVRLGPLMMDLAELLAENTHNLWAKSRIENKWSYGDTEDPRNHRTPLLVEYKKLEPTAKKGVKEAAMESVRLIVVLGFIIEPPNVENLELKALQGATEQQERHRIFRLDSISAVKSGKWYYELQLVTSGSIRVGWAFPSIKSQPPLGSDENSFVFDGSKPMKLNGGIEEKYGKRWKTGDVIGCLLDLDEKTISFTLNGEILMDKMGRESAFDHVNAQEGMIPCCSFATGESARINFGRDEQTFIHYYTVGYQEGFLPFCHLMMRPPSMWCSKTLPAFTSISNQEDIYTHRTTSTEGNPCIKVKCKKVGDYQHQSHYLRLSLPVLVTGMEAEKPTDWQPLSERTESSAINADEEVSEDGLEEEEQDPEFENRRPTEFSVLRKKNHSKFLTAIKHQPNIGRVANRIGTWSAATKRKIMHKGSSEDLPDDYLPSDSDYNDSSRSHLPDLLGFPDIKKLGGGKKDRKLSHIAKLLPIPHFLPPKPFEDTFDWVEYGSKFQYTVRIYQGQDLKNIYIGWVSPSFHGCTKGLEEKGSRKVTVKLAESKGETSAGERFDCFLAKVEQLSWEVEDGDSNPLTGLVVDVILDIQFGEISFAVNNQACRTKFKAEIGQMLFPGAYVIPTSKEVFQFEFTRSKFARPLSAGLFASEKFNLTPICPPRLTVQAIQPISWTRLPTEMFISDISKVPENKGWRIQTGNPVTYCAMLIPEEEKSFDILELCEFPELLNFHVNTLKLYRALTEHANHRSAHLLTEHVSERQFMHLLQCPYLPGPLRSGFYELLLSMHFEYAAHSMLSTESEYVYCISRDVVLDNPKLTIEEIEEEDPDYVNFVRPLIRTCTAQPNQTVVQNYAKIGSPSISVSTFKNLCLTSLTEGVSRGISSRDPPGGTYSYFFTPLLRLCDSLFVTKALNAEETGTLMSLIDPPSGSEIEGLLTMPLEEDVKLVLCSLLKHICDSAVRRWIGKVVVFANHYMGEAQLDQKRRYIELITEPQQQASVVARRTKEFRCSPIDQVRSLVSFKLVDEPFSPCRDDLKYFMESFFDDIVNVCGYVEESAEGEDSQVQEGFFRRVANAFKLWGSSNKSAENDEESPNCFKKLVVNSMISWTSGKNVKSEDLLRSLFNLLYRQFDGLGNVRKSLETTYVLGCNAKNDVASLFTELVNVRALLNVRMGPDEEKSMIDSINAITFNKVFFQHPNLMQQLRVHETVMNVMVNVMSKSSESADSPSDGDVKNRRSSVAVIQTPALAEEWNPDMVISCCRCLSFFCRTSPSNQRAMFQNLDFLLDNSFMGLSYPSMRGSTPLDVAAASINDNTELALALREHQLERIVTFLTVCGVKSNAILCSKGIPDIGWDPVVGERFLDFLKNTVWVKGESVEENAFQVVRLLIRRPECLGPALSAGGQGLLQAVVEGISMQHNSRNNKDEDVNVMSPMFGDVPTQPEVVEKSPDDVEIGSAILEFYSVLIDLLGRAASSGNGVEEGHGEAARIGAILRSLVPVEDLLGVLSMKFALPSSELLQEQEASENTSWVGALQPSHKASMVVFLDRVYGITDLSMLVDLLETCFLPDLRAAIILDNVSTNQAEFTFAVNRYLCQVVLPLLTRYSPMLLGSNHGSLMETALLTVYRFFRCPTLTNAQKKSVSAFMVAIIKNVNPCDIQHFLKKICEDLKTLAPHTHVSYRVLTLLYEKYFNYYNGITTVDIGAASDEEKGITLEMFQGFFDALVKKNFDNETFKQTLPCLLNMSSAVPPDYIHRQRTSNLPLNTSVDENGQYLPQPVNTDSIALNKDLAEFVVRLAEQMHDEWAKEMMSHGWSYGPNLDEDNKKHPRLKPIKLLADQDQEEYKGPIRQKVKTVLAMGYQIEKTTDTMQRDKKTAQSIAQFKPSPLDLSPTSLTKDLIELAEAVAENSHDRRKYSSINNPFAKARPVDHQFVPYDLLTDSEKSKERTMSHAFIKFFQICGFKVIRTKPEQDDTIGHLTAGLSENKRFSLYLLEKIMIYAERASKAMRENKSASLGDNPHGVAPTKLPESVVFFISVIIPLLHRYIITHFQYFVTTFEEAKRDGCINASPREKELLLALFCKIAFMFRDKGSPLSNNPESAKCLELISEALEFRAILKTKNTLLMEQFQQFFANAAIDIQKTNDRVNNGDMDHITSAKSSFRGARNMRYIISILMPVLRILFIRIAHSDCGKEILDGELQLNCYKILDSLYTLAANERVCREHPSRVLATIRKERPVIGSCLAAFAQAMPVAFLEPHLMSLNPQCIFRKKEYKDQLSSLTENIPTLELIMSEVEIMTNTQGNDCYDPLLVIEVLLPLICSYLPAWATHGPKTETPEHSCPTGVKTEHMNIILGNILRLIQSNLGKPSATWMTNVASFTQPVMNSADSSLLPSHFLPVTQMLEMQMREILNREESIRQKFHSGEDTTDFEEQLQTDMNIVIRDLYAFLPLVLSFIDMHRSIWMESLDDYAFLLFSSTCEIFNCWSKSQTFRREETNYVLGNKIDTLRYLTTENSDMISSHNPEPLSTDLEEHAVRQKKCDLFTPSMSLVTVSCKRMVPVGMSRLDSALQEIIQKSKQSLIRKESNEEVLKSIKAEVQQLLKEPDGVNILGSYNAEAIFDISDVLKKLHYVDHPPQNTEKTVTKPISKARKRAVMECFKMIPLYNLPRFKAINYFIKAFYEKWLDSESKINPSIITLLTNEDDAESDPLTQIVAAIKRAAQVVDEASGSSKGIDTDLYNAYASIMASSCSCGGDDEEEEGGGEPSFEEQEMAKQQLIAEQTRLANRGCAEMVLLMISKCAGDQNDSIETTLQLGIAILSGGNVSVQTSMLNYLQEKRDGAFFKSVAGLMDSCTVLNLDSFERSNKAEDMGAILEGDRVMPDASFTEALFRFIQLLCEGHNNDWQNYLRVQVGAITSINIVTASVDYLVRLQESMSDFFWHYSSSDTIDARGREAFLRAIQVGKQVFASLTEMIQGPCVGNQLALALSRLWDAVAGFLHVFSNLQEKLSQDPTQMEFLRELLDLQKEMITLMLSMLEGNVLNGKIGQQMVDTLVQSSQNVENVLQFFTMFLKLNDIVDGDAFKEYDLNGDGIIQESEFRFVLEQQKVYSDNEITFLLECADKNADGKISAKEFTQRFTEPASEIGFNVALLLTNLSEHTTQDPRLEKLVESAQALTELFEEQLGRIEILGSSKRIERVYFEISKENKSSWEAEAIKESKREFLFSGVVGEADTEKLDTFVNFSEDSIYEMQHTRSLSASDDEEPSEPLLSRLKSLFGLFWMILFSPLKLCKLLFRMLFFILFTMPFTIFIKWPFKFFWTIFSIIIWKPICKIIEEANALAKNATLTPTTPVEYSPLPDLVIDDTEGNEAKRSNSHNSEKESTQPKILTATESQVVFSHPKAPEFVNTLFDSWLQNREKSVSFTYSSRVSDDMESDDTSARNANSKSSWEIFMCLLARNFYKIKYAALIFAFIINIILLFSRISYYTPEKMGEESVEPAIECSSDDCPSGDDDKIEFVTVDEDKQFLEPTLIAFAAIHACISFLMVLAYYKLKVPLLIFQREKEVSRNLEFDGLYMVSHPEWSNFRAQWDKLVISTRSFPVNMWDKFVKKRAKSKYTGILEEEEVDKILGMSDNNPSFISSLLGGFDIKYNIWKFGVIFSDKAFLYIFFYFVFSVCGNFNRFFFAIHLMDIAIGTKDLSAILQSVTHNGKQLVLTVMLTSIVIYMYTVVAFNFFRNFYEEEPEEDSDPTDIALMEQKCDSMWTCFIFHLHHGLRAGGGIGDEIDDPNGHPSEYFRIVFDMTFFFFVIVILLAIIQGLIIDAFGELRGQLEQTKEDLETKCFICGLGKDYFDEQAAHGFETHTEKEHNFANYMFFLMYLINKDETEYTGQETYVWNLYQEKNFDFFPIGDCFRKQYEEELK